METFHARIVHPVQFVDLSHRDGASFNAAIAAYNRLSGQTHPYPAAVGSLAMHFFVIDQFSA
jgi:hypothetical protein